MRDASHAKECRPFELQNNEKHNIIPDASSPLKTCQVDQVHFHSRNLRRLYRRAWGFDAILCESAETADWRAICVSGEEIQVREALYINPAICLEGGSGINKRAEVLMTPLVPGLAKQRCHIAPEW